MEKVHAPLLVGLRCVKSKLILSNSPDIDMRILRNVALRRWLSVFLMFVAGGLPGLIDGKPPQSSLTHGIIIGFLGFGIVSMPVLFQQKDGVEPNLLAKLGYAFASCLLPLAVATASCFELPNQEYSARLLKVGLIIGTAFLGWCGYIVWRHRGPHQNVTKL